MERREKFPLSEHLKSDILLNETSLVNLKLFNVQFEKKHSQTDKDDLKNKTDLNESKENINSQIGSPGGNVTVKYIQCVAHTPIRIIVRMLRNKYNRPSNFVVIFTIDF